MEKPYALLKKEGTGRFRRRAVVLLLILVFLE